MSHTTMFAKNSPMAGKAVEVVAAAALADTAAGSFETYVTECVPEQPALAEIDMAALHMLFCLSVGSNALQLTAEYLKTHQVHEDPDYDARAEFDRLARVITTGIADYVFSDSYGSGVRAGNLPTSGSAN